MTDIADLEERLSYLEVVIDDQPEMKARFRMVGEAIELLVWLITDDEDDEAAESAEERQQQVDDAIAQVAEIGRLLSMTL